MPCKEPTCPEPFECKKKPGAPDHVWPESGILIIERCERYCYFCRKTLKAGKKWKYAWYLRRHVEVMHAGKTHPGLIVAEGWESSATGNKKPWRARGHTPPMGRFSTNHLQTPKSKGRPTTPKTPKTPTRTQKRAAQKKKKTASGSSSPNSTFSDPFTTPPPASLANTSFTGPKKQLQLSQGFITDAGSFGPGGNDVDPLPSMFNNDNDVAAFPVNNVAPYFNGGGALAFGDDLFAEIGGLFPDTNAAGPDINFDDLFGFDPTGGDDAQEDDGAGRVSEEAEEPEGDSDGAESTEGQEENLDGGSPTPSESVVETTEAPAADNINTPAATPIIEATNEIITISSTSSSDSVSTGIYQTMRTNQTVIESEAAGRAGRDTMFAFLNMAVHNTQAMHALSEREILQVLESYTDLYKHGKSH